MTHPLRIVYAGTPEFAVPALQALLQSVHSVVAVYTQPDRPAGRGQTMAASAVKLCAQANALAIEQPVNFRSDEAVATLRSYRPDAMVVAAYGLLLPQVVLDIPRLGCINIHGSLLPRWRGAAPIQRAILEGDEQTGITLMRMEAGLDTGPMLGSEALAIRAFDTAATVHDRLAALGAELLLDVLQDLPVALARAQPQPALGVTYAKKITKAEATMDWSLPAIKLDRQVRAFNPWPIAQTTLRGQPLRIWQAQSLPAAHRAAPGTVLSAAAQGIQVACGAGILNLTQVQQAGRKVVSAAEFINSHALLGVQLGIATGTPS